MMKPTTAFIAAAAAFALAACGGGSTGPSYSNTIDSATVATLAETAHSLATATLDNAFGSQNQSLLGLLPSASSARQTTAFDRAQAIMQHALALTASKSGVGLQAAVPLRLSAPFVECTPTVTGADSTGNPIDADGNGIPDDYTANFGSACVQEDSAGTARTTISGSVHIKDNNVGFLGFTLALNNLKIKNQPDLTSTDYTVFSLNGSETASFAAALASHSTNFTLAELVHSGSTDVSATIIDNETSSFDPDNTFSLALGAPLPAGVFNYNSDFRVVGENSGGAVAGNFHLVLSTPTPLHFNPGCLSEIDAGVFRGLLNGNQNIGFTATWSSCADPVIVIFGDTPPAAVAAR